MTYQDGDVIIPFSPKKRYGRVKAKPGQLLLKYGKPKYDAPDICMAWGGDGASKADANLMHSIFFSRRLAIDFEKSGGRDYKFINTLAEELDKRGYDLSTLEFSIWQKGAKEELKQQKDE